MKKSIFLVCVSILYAVSSAWAAPWAVVANSYDLKINTIDVGTGDVYGPFLGGQLGTSGEILDVAAIKEGRFALVSNPDGQTVYRIDLLDPTNPVVTDEVDIGFPANDIAIADNSNFALVTGGGFGTNEIAIIDLSNFTSTTYALKTQDAQAQAIAIAPDNKTVIVCDWYNSRIIYFTVNPDTGIPNSTESTRAVSGNPVNVAISPNGDTVLVATGTAGGLVNVFVITTPGVVQQGITTTVPGPERPYSIAFSPDGEHAYYLSIASSPDSLVFLDIIAPGNVTLDGAAVDLLTDQSGGYFGVDVVSVSPDGQYAVVGNQDETGTVSPNVALVNLTTRAVSTLYTESTYPTGTAFLIGGASLSENLKCPFDIDIYTFRGESGEVVDISLDSDVSGIATLKLSSGLFRPLSGDIGYPPLQIHETLPYTGTYKIVVRDSWFFWYSRFCGSYDLTLESSKDAFTTLRKDWWSF